MNIRQFESATNVADFIIGFVEMQTCVGQIVEDPRNEMEGSNLPYFAPTFSVNLGTT